MTAEITDEDLERFFGESAPYRHVFEQVQSTIASDDRDGFANLIRYPFTIYKEKAECCGADAVDSVEDSAEFVERFDEIVTADVRKMILNQRFDDLNISWRGLGFELGVLWITGNCIGPDEDDPCTETTIGVQAIHSYVTKYSKQLSK